MLVAAFWKLVTVGDSKGGFFAPFGRAEGASLQILFFGNCRGAGADRARLRLAFVGSAGEHIGSPLRAAFITTNPNEPQIRFWANCPPRGRGGWARGCAFSLRLAGVSSPSNQAAHPGRHKKKL